MSAVDRGTVLVANLDQERLVRRSGTFGHVGQFFFVDIDAQSRACGNVDMSTAYWHEFIGYVVFPEVAEIDVIDGGHLEDRDFMHQVYTKAAPDYSGRVTVPTLWDKKKETIASNESAEIIRMFNSAFDGLKGVRTDLDFYPGELQEEIDTVNARVYDTVNNGVYKAGFATAQDKYEEAYNALFDSLDWLEERLSSQRYLVGGRLTEADWRLFTTLIRFDAVYYSHFKCNRQRISDFPALSAYVRDLYQVPGVAKTVDIDQIKRHYYVSQRTINPTQIVPVGPELDFDSPHGRESLS